MSRPRRLLVAACVVGGGLLAAAPGAAAGGLNWKPCGDAGAQCATETVPFSRSTALTTPTPLCDLAAAFLLSFFMSMPPMPCD